MFERLASPAPWKKTGRGLSAFLRSCSGAAAVEFAFTMPIFLLFLMGIIESGRAIWTNYSLQTAVEDTARYVLAHPTVTDAQIQTFVVNKLDLLDTTRMTVTVARETVTGVNFVSVTASYAFMTLEMIFPTGTISLVGRSRVPLTAPTT
jgi:Flp pilus assembly protein TadG